MTIGPPQAMDIWFMCEFLGIRAQKNRYQCMHAPASLSSYTDIRIILYY